MRKIFFSIFYTLIYCLFSYNSYASQEIYILKNMYKRPLDIPYPKNNPYSLAKEKLGKMLFFDPRLSRSKVMSCATCHNPSLAWGDGLPKSVGDFHKELSRRTPTIINLAWDRFFFWDGRSTSLEKQALAPIESESEMGIPLSVMIEDLKDISGYKTYFGEAFPNDKDPISKDNLSKAIATFERTLVTKDTPFDKWIKGDDKAISQEAKNGFILFNTKAKCATCHIGWNFSDNNFHDIGVKTTDSGRYNVTKTNDMKHAFKTPSLRNIYGRSPYMHNGSIETLMDVIEHYDNGFIQRESLSPEIKPLALTVQEKKELVAFLQTLTSQEEDMTFPLLPR